VKHKIQLTGIGTHKAGDILSEGEHRIVTLAAFLATVTAKPDKAPFVFDDPISSLDQEYEEKTIDRLIELSADRQVIVLTHRLSFVGILVDKADPEIVTIKHEAWGTGQPGVIPIFGRNPVGALRSLKTSRLVHARTALTNEGQDAYYPLAKAICSDMRILVERMVELVFLADVVQRHRRAVHTQGKIKHLAKITAADCALVDKFMSRYSSFEHSQPSEAPVELPTPDELGAELDELIAWHDEFRARPAP
jgi:wobble nucleotide-excising tRNase